MNALYRLSAVALLGIGLSSCASLIPNQKKDYLGLSSVELKGTLAPVVKQAAIVTTATSWSGDVAYSGSFGDITGLSVDPTSLSIPLNFVSAVLGAACVNSESVTLAVNSWSIKLSDVSNPTGLTKSSSVPFTLTSMGAGTNLTLNGSGAGALVVAFSELKPILTGGGQNTVTASANVTLKGCGVDGSSLTLGLTTSTLEQTLSFK